jgi:cell division inhibitor SepF
MAASLRKMGVYLGLMEDEAGYGEGSDSYDRESGAREFEAPVRAEAPARSARRPEPRADVRQEYGRVTETAVAARDWPAEAEHYSPEYADLEAASSYRITTLHPRTYNEAVTIGEHFRSGTPVIMNLTEMADGDAKRLVDFAAGLTFGLHGRVERVTAKVFLLSPQNVTVTAQDKARIAENGFFNQS